MKKLSTFYRWIIISVLLQIIILSYAEFIYLPNRGNIKATVYDVSEDNLKNKDISIPDGASDITVSFNGLFAAYKLDGKINVLDVKNRKDLKSLELSEGEYSYYRWLPDRNMLIYAEKEPDGKQGQVRISTYDVSADLERSYPKITGLADGSEVMDIEVSPLTNVVYAMVKTGTTRTRIYKYDIMDNLKSFMTADAGTKLAEAAYSDTLIYQKTNGKIYAKNGKTGETTSISPKAGAVLLGIDSEDRVYAGIADDSGKITAIYSGKADEDTQAWKKTGLDSPAAPAEIMITPGGSIYLADKERNKISKADGSDVKGFEGQLIGILDDYMVTLDGNKLKLTIIK